MTERQVDIIRTSTSRPEILELTTESWREHLKFDGKLRWMLHEDVVDKGRTEAIAKIAASYYDVFQIDNPPIGQGSSVRWLLNQTGSSTKYVINIEDDWKLLKDINLDVLYDLMDNHENINQITFNKRPIMMKKQWFIKKEIEIDGISLVTNMYWTFIPALWRKDWIIPKLPKNFEETSGGKCSYGVNTNLRKIFGSNLVDEDHNADWVMANIGTYFLGNVMKNYKALVEKKEIDPDVYDNLDNGFYVQHVGYRPYEPERWIWPLEEPPKMRSYDRSTVKYTNNRKNIPKTKSGQKWNPTLTL